MNVSSKVNRIFGACILLMMAVLTVCTITFTAAAEGDSNSSYSLVIAKIFDFEQPDYNGVDLPDEVKELAKDQTYTFKITGTRRDGDQTVPVNITFELPRKGEDGRKIWESEVYRSNGPFDVMVTELTDNIDITDKKGNHYNMSGSSPDTRVMVSSRKHEVRLRNNSILTIQRPANAGNEELWYRVTNRPYDAHGTSGSYRPVDEVFSLKAGEAEKKIKKLCAAVYTIEQIAAPDGYQLQMGERVEAVSPGNNGYFHINGTPGRLTLTAGGTRGDGATHYYRVDRTETESGDTSEFVKRTVPIASGESCVLDNLPKGGYTVTEFTIDAGEAFKVTVPETKERTRNEKSSALTTGTANSWKYMDLKDSKFDVDYIKMVSFGPLRNSSGTKLSSKTSYAVFRYGVLSEDGTKITNIKTHNTGYTGNKTVTINNPPKMDVKSHKRLYFTVTGLQSTTAKTIDVSWIEYDERETEKTFKRAGSPESITADERRWIKIEAPALNDPNADGADQIAYYYTIRDKDGNLVQGTTDRDGTSIKLLPGTSTNLSLPAAGSYTVVENIVGNTSVGFTMKIAGQPFGTTEAGTPIEVQVGGRRDVTISKPAVGIVPEGASDNRIYAFSVTGPGSFSSDVKIKAGESQTVSLPGEGTYTIRPQNDSLGVYNLFYSDSGAIYGTASGSTGTITFTNSFSRGAYAYRYVHEYYVRDIDEDGDYVYSYEGNSPITTRMGREEEEKFEALDLIQEPKYNENSYEHFSEGYGWVDPITEKTSVQADLEEGIQADVICEENEASGEGAETPSDSGTVGTGDGEEPETPKEDTAEVGEGEEQETPKEDAAEAGEGEEQEASKEDAAKAGEGEEQEAPKEDAAKADDGEEQENPDGDTTAPSDSGEMEAPGEDVSDSGESEETEDSKESSPETGDSGEAELYSEESETLGAAADTGDNSELETPEEDPADAGDDGESETPAEDAGDNGDDGESETPAEDAGDNEDDGESETPAEDAGDAGDDGESETPAEDAGDNGDGGESETPAEDAGDNGDGGESETPAEDAGDAGDDGESETPAEDAGDNGESETPAEDAGDNGESETPAEDTTDPDAGSEPETPKEDVSDVDNGNAPVKSDENAADAADGEKAEAEDSLNAVDIEVTEFSNEEVFNGEDAEVTKIRSAESYDPAGIVDRGVGIDSGSGILNYAPESDKDHISVTEDASQIIILRYYRDRQPEGKYNVIHVYYFRDEDGDHWEGISGVQPQNGELGVKYNGHRVDKVYDFQPADADQSYTYTWDGRPQYGELSSTDEEDSGNEFAGNGLVYRPNNAWTSVEGTEEGNQIIILRYYRELSKEGNYNIVHEYYVREPDGNQDSVTDASWPGEAVRLLSEDEEEDSETGEAEEDSSSTFIGTLDRSRNDGFVYTFEGNTKPEVLTALLGTTHTAEEDDWKLAYGENTYTYMDVGYGTKSGGDDYSCNPNQQWAASTEQGDDIIILRYIREGISEDPEDPEDPPEDPKDPSQDPEDPPEDPKDPSQDPEDPEDPPEDPKDPSQDPEKPSETSKRSSRDSSGSQRNPDVSREIVSLENGVPVTGDDSQIVFWMLLATGLLCGLIIWRSPYRKRTDE